MHVLTMCLVICNFHHDSFNADLIINVYLDFDLINYNTNTQLVKFVLNLCTYMLQS